MRYMSLVRTLGDDRAPPPALMNAMGAFVTEALAAGVLVDTGGLSTSAQSFRMRLAGGKLNVIDGPFTESKELVGGYAIMELKSREEALDWTRRFMKLHQDHWPEWEGECELREMLRPPMLPDRQPSQPAISRRTTMRFMMLMIPAVYADANATADMRPDAKAMAAMSKFNDRLSKAGVLLSLDGLHPPAAATRVAFGAGKPKITDGPFAEAKEVLGGYWLIDVKSKEEAVDWAAQCPAAPGDVIEIRQVFEMSDFPEDVQKAAGV